MTFIKLYFIHSEDFKYQVYFKILIYNSFFIHTFVTGPLNQVLELAFASFVILESRIEDILYSGSPSMMTGGSGTEFRPEKGFGVAGSIMETWNTGWIERMLSGR